MFTGCSPGEHRAVLLVLDPLVMRVEFRRGLAALNDECSTLCTLATNCMIQATAAWLHSDIDAAQRVVGCGVLLTQLRSAAENRGVSLLALQAPVASDLRTIVAALWNIGDLHRMGVLAIHVARAAWRRHPRPVVPSAAHATIEQMARLSIDVADTAGRALHGADGSAGIADAIDAKIDALQRDLFAMVLAPTWPHGVDSAIDTVLLSRFYERFADHGVAIAHRVVFLRSAGTPTDRGPTAPPTLPPGTGIGTRPVGRPTGAR